MIYNHLLINNVLKINYDVFFYMSALCSNRKIVIACFFLFLLEINTHLECVSYHMKKKTYIYTVIGTKIMLLFPYDKCYTFLVIDVCGCVRWVGIWRGVVVAAQLIGARPK